MNSVSAGAAPVSSLVSSPVPRRTGEELWKGALITPMVAMRRSRRRRPEAPDLSGHEREKRPHFETHPGMTHGPSPMLDRFRRSRMKISPSGKMRCICWSATRLIRATQIEIQPDVRLFCSKKRALMISSAVPQTDEGTIGRKWTKKNAGFVPFGQFSSMFVGLFSGRCC